MILKIKYVMVFIAIILTEHSFAGTFSKSSLDSLPKFQLQGDSCVFNFLADQQYIFIEGSIGTVKGKFMFDTGSQAALIINSLFVKLPGGKKIGTGFNGTGEHYDVMQLDTVRNIVIDGRCTFSAVGPAVASEEKGIQDGLMPDFLGLIGFNFFKGYILRLDYLHHKLILYKSSSSFAEHKRYLNGEHVLSVLNFEKRKAPNHPLINVKIDGIPLEAEFDTGQPGTFYPTESTKSRLLLDGVLSPPNDNNESKLNAVELATGLKIDLNYLHVRPHDTGNAMKKSIGITEDDFIGLGYGFLSEFVTVWDYDNQKIYLLAQ